MKHRGLFILALFSICSLVLAWHVQPLWFLGFVGLVPLLYACQRLSKYRYLFFCWLVFFGFNAGASYWLYKVHWAVALLVFCLSAAMQATPFLAMYWLVGRVQKIAAVSCIVPFYMLAEYASLHGQLSWPWLLLGHLFKQNRGLVQWYRYTGVAGGSLWVLLVNVGIFLGFQYFKKGGRDVLKTATFLVLLGFVLFVPIVISKKIDVQNGGPALKPITVLAIQPNVVEEVNHWQYDKHKALERLIASTKAHLTPKTQLAIWPEGCLNFSVPFDSLHSYQGFRPLFDFLKAYPNLHLLSGMVLQEPCYDRQKQFMYNRFFNAAVLFRYHQKEQVYVKQKLVPGIEALPSYLERLRPLLKQIGFNYQNFSTDYAHHQPQLRMEDVKITPAICYETAYGQYFGGTAPVANTFMVVLTNDAWFDGTTEPREHFNLAQLRAVENGLPLVQASNTGLSGCMDTHGNVTSVAKPSPNKTSFLLAEMRVGE